MTSLIGLLSIWSRGGMTICKRTSPVERVCRRLVSRLLLEGDNSFEDLHVSTRISRAFLSPPIRPCLWSTEERSCTESMDSMRRRRLSSFHLNRRASRSSRRNDEDSPPSLVLILMNFCLRRSCWIFFTISGLDNERVNLFVSGTDLYNDSPMAVGVTVDDWASFSSTPFFYEGRKGSESKRVF